jgi:hypothetical protein
VVVVEAELLWALDAELGFDVVGAFVLVFESVPLLALADANLLSDGTSRGARRLVIDLVLVNRRTSFSSGFSLMILESRSSVLLS